MMNAGTEIRDTGELLHPGNAPLRVLLVEDDPMDAELVLRELKKGGFEISGKVVQTPEEFLFQIKSHRPDIVLADYNLGQWMGMETLELLRRENLNVPVIVVSGAVGDVTAVECIKQGATDYVLKDGLARLPVAVRRALLEKHHRELRQQAEENLAQKNEELVRSNLDLEQFAYVASHDLQEPLRMVAAYTQLLAERYQGKLDEQADKYIHYAVDGAARMQTLIQDLLSFSRAGRPGANPDRADCNLLVEQALKNLQAAIHDSHATVDCAPLPVVIANRSQLAQVFQNLISNAIKFRGSKTPVIRISAEPDGEEWVFSVADNGIGIAPQHIDTIFDVFKRLHTRTEYPGNGIGLAICKRIIERHGGRIWVADQDQSGTIFKFRLPSAKAAAAVGGNG